MIFFSVSIETKIRDKQLLDSFLGDNKNVPLNKDERKESIRNIKENIKGSLNEIRHEVKDTVKVCSAYLTHLRYKKSKAATRI